LTKTRDKDRKILTNERQGQDNNDIKRDKDRKILIKEGKRTGKY
jgi:hypothetical protein